MTAGELLFSTLVSFCPAIVARAQVSFSCTSPLTDPDNNGPPLAASPSFFTLYPSLDTSQCSGTIVGYQFCTQFMRNTGQSRTVFTVLLLEDIGSSYNVLHENTLLEDRNECSSNGVCCVDVELNSNQYITTGPNLTYAFVTPLAQDAGGNFLLKFNDHSTAYVKIASLYTLGSSSVTKAALGIVNDSPVSVRQKRFRFLIQQPQPSTPVVVTTPVAVTVTATTTDLVSHNTCCVPYIYTMCKV